MSPLDEPTLLEDAVLADLRVLASDAMRGRHPDTLGSARAREYIVARLHELGVTPLGASYEHPFSWTGDDGRYKYGTNVVGLLAGTARGGRTIVLSAHYDHLGTTGDGDGPPTIPPDRIYSGADDNASGVAALLGLARHFTRHRPRHSLVLAFFDAEEADLKGSSHFVAAPPIALDTVALNVNLDMLGRNLDERLWAVGARHHPWIREVLAPVAERAPLRLEFGHDRFGWVPFLSWDWTTESDHGAFHDRGIPFVYFGVANHEDTHETSDTADGIDEEFFVRAFRTVMDAVEVLDADSTLVNRGGAEEPEEARRNSNG
ncbi:MAG TPA: M20/M25/M40 family metallo-hydrolase [Gemmatimonadaceae bacterium]|nr:M20/M25/M40 family metallo-hydrolase [Gemmatimonadaceae bacterium]